MPLLDGIYQPYARPLLLNWEPIKPNVNRSDNVEKSEASLLRATESSGAVHQKEEVQKGFEFFKLPTELRTAIYELLVVNPIFGLEVWPWHELSKMQVPEGYKSIFLDTITVSKQFFAESLAVFFSKNIFMMGLGMAGPLKLESWESGMRYLSDWPYWKIESFKIVFMSEELFCDLAPTLGSSLLVRMPRLKKLVIRAVYGGMNASRWKFEDDRDRWETAIRAIIVSTNERVDLKFEWFAGDLETSKERIKFIEFVKAVERDAQYLRGSEAPSQETVNAAVQAAIDQSRQRPPVTWAEQQDRLAMFGGMR